MKNAELFRNGQGKPEVLKETWVEQFNVHGSGLKSANRDISIRMMPQQGQRVSFTQWVKEANVSIVL